MPYQWESLLLELFEDRTCCHEETDTISLAKYEIYVREKITYCRRRHKKLKDTEDSNINGKDNSNRDLPSLTWSMFLREESPEKKTDFTSCSRVITDVVFICSDSRVVWCFPSLTLVSSPLYRQHIRAFSVIDTTCKATLQTTE